MTAAVYTFGTVAYCILASGSIQPWAFESAALHASDSNVMEVELNGTDAPLDPEKHSSSFISNPASERHRNDNTSSLLLKVSS